MFNNLSHDLSFMFIFGKDFLVRTTEMTMKFNFNLMSSGVTRGLLRFEIIPTYIGESGDEWDSAYFSQAKINN